MEATGIKLVTLEDQERAEPFERRKESVAPLFVSLFMSIVLF